MEEPKKHNTLKAIIISFVVLVFAIPAAAQEGKQKISFDFDGDKKMDVFQIKDGKLVYALTSQANKTVTSKGGSYADQTYLELKGNVIVYHCIFMRASNTFKFRYDAKLKAIRLIGYDNEQFGNALNDGSGLSSYNLLTGDYKAQWNYFDRKKGELMAYPPVSKKYPAKVYLLKDFGEEVVDALYQVDARHIK
jgi:hypothetical protein